MRNYHVNVNGTAYGQPLQQPPLPRLPRPLPPLRPRPLPAPASR